MQRWSAEVEIAGEVGRTVAAQALGRSAHVAKSIDRGAHGLVLSVAAMNDPQNPDRRLVAAAIFQPDSEAEAAIVAAGEGAAGAGAGAEWGAEDTALLTPRLPALLEDWSIVPGPDG